MNSKIILIIAVVSSLLFSSCKKCPEFENPPLYLDFRIIDKNSNIDLLYTKKYNLDSILVYYLDNGVNHQIKMESYRDTLNKRVILGSSDWIQKSLAGQKQYFLKLHSSDIDTVLFNVVNKEKECNSFEQIQNFEINGIELSQSEPGIFGVYKK